MSLQVYTFEDGEFTFWTAKHGCVLQSSVYLNYTKIIFRVRTDNTSIARAKEKGIVTWETLEPATDQEIEVWRISHPHDPILGGKNESRR